MHPPILFARTWRLFLTLLCSITFTQGLNAQIDPPRDRRAVDLGGEWEFQMDPLDVGRAEKWFDAGHPFRRTIRVPGSWNAQGMAFESEPLLRQYEEQRLAEQKSLNQLGILGVQRESDRLFSVFPGPAWYRRQVTVPADWTGKIPWLEFEGVHREAEVWVSGKPAGTHASYLTPFRIDISPFAKAGETVSVVVRVDARRNRDRDPLMGCLDTLDFLYVTWGGIYRPVTLEATEGIRIADVFVLPRLADSTAEIRVTIEGPTSERLQIRTTFHDADGTPVATVEGDLTEGKRELTLIARLATPRLWSPQVAPSLLDSNPSSVSRPRNGRSRGPIRHARADGRRWEVPAERKARVPARLR